MNFLWIKDPSTDLPSVSLTLLVYTFVGTIIAGALNMAGVVSSTSLFSEIFYSSTALYFGRRLNFAGKQYTSEKADEIAKKVE
jgi:hypothetical protein